MSSSGINTGAVEGNAPLTFCKNESVNINLSHKLAYDLNHEYSAAFEVLVEILREHSEPVYYGRYQTEDYLLTRNR